MRPFTIEQAHTEIDRLLAKAVNQKGVLPVTCSRGCCACCSEPLMANMEEAELAARSIPPGELPVVQARLRAWLERFLANGFDKLEKLLVMDYKRAGLPCPLLKNRECMIYANRPIACRTHCAIGQPEKCENDRLHQKYALVPQLEILSGCILLSDGQAYDHFGVLLARLLLKSNVSTAASLMAEAARKELGEVTFKIVQDGTPPDANDAPSVAKDAP